MMRRTPVFIVCSPQPRAGATTTARLLTDYNIAKGVPVEGFDTDPHEPRYAELFPRQVRLADIADIKGQIALFDRLLVQDQAPKIVDLWHRSYERFFDIVRDIGFFEEARRSGVEPILLFQAAASPRAASCAQEVALRWPQLRLMLVRNEGAAPLGPRPLDILARYPAQGKFVIPALEPPVARALDDERLSLAHFLAAPPAGMSIIVRAALRNWLIPIFTQFRSFELRREFEQSDFFK